MNSITQFFDGLFNKTPKAAITPKSEIIVNYGDTLKDAVSTVLDLFDKGLNVYADVAERVNAINLVKAEIEKNKQAILNQNQTQTTSAQDFFKSNTGVIVAGTIGALILVAVLSGK